MTAVTIHESSDLSDIKKAHLADSQNIEKLRALLEFLSLSRQAIFLFLTTGMMASASTEAPSSSLSAQETMQPTQGINTSDNVQYYREFVYGLTCIFLPLASLVYRSTQSTGRTIGWKPYLNKVFFETPVFLYFLSGILSLTSATVFQASLSDDPANQTKAKTAQIFFSISMLLVQDAVFSFLKKLFAKPEAEATAKPGLPYGAETDDSVPRFKHREIQTDLEKQPMLPVLPSSLSGSQVIASTAPTPTHQYTVHITGGAVYFAPAGSSSNTQPAQSAALVPFKA